MKDIKEIPAEVCKELLVILCDIDDTITTLGKVTSCAYQALWEANKAGIQVVPVTGRPGGWVDHIARMWPVAGVVGENGAFYFYMTKSGLKRRFVQDEETRIRNRLCLEKIGKEILTRFPEVKIAMDQRYRETDLAIDFREDVRDLNLEIAEKIKGIFKAHGAKAKVSSIHINGWFGDYDKLKTSKLFLKEVLNLDMDLESHRKKVLFCGDSPNDEPMFEFFPLSVGVANIKMFSNYMKCHPLYVTQKAFGEGFSELIRTILLKRRLRVS